MRCGYIHTAYLLSVLICLLLGEFNCDTVFNLFVFVDKSVNQAGTEQAAHRIERHQREEHLHCNKEGHDKTGNTNCSVVRFAHSL